MLVAEGLAKAYDDVVALRSADLRVDAGQIVTLLGRNGAGKSTMLSIIAGLLKPDGGRVSVDGVDALADPERAAQLIGIAPQETGIYPILTVRQNLEFFAELSGLTRSKRSRRAIEVAEQLGLTKLLDRRGGQLSGGEARRLHTACALVHTPGLLMLDEPTVGADVTTRAQLIDAVRDLASGGAAVVYTTHYLPEVEALDADIVIIDEGEIKASGTRESLLAEHELRGLRFQVDGPLPEGFDLEATEVEADTYRVLGPHTMADLLDRFVGQTDRLVSVEALKPELETVFLAVTGNRLDAEDEPATSDGEAEPS